jgi:ADP-ribose pyrophosphatase
VLLVEQRRPPVNAWVVELPAGLAGDDEGLPQESLAAAARRELIEETGYDAGRIEQVFEGPSSAGLTDEIVTFLVATDLVKIAPGGGVGGENIVVHEIPRESVFPWIESRRREGRMVDARLYTGLYLLDHVLPRNA